MAGRRVAVAGKGGAGKTTIAGTLARALGGRGEPVLAVDADPNPNLGLTLGLSPEQFDHGVVLTRDLLEPVKRGEHSEMVLGCTLDELLDDYALAAPAGVRLLTMARPEHAGVGCLCGAHATVRGILATLDADAPVTTIVDLEASPEHMTRATTEHVDHLLIVAEPYFKSLETARRYHALATELELPRISLVGNRTRPGDDVVADYCAERGYEHLGSVPFDETFAETDRLGTAPIDHSPDSPGVVAIHALADRLGERLPA